MAGGDGGQGVWVLWGAIAPPDDVHVGAQQQEIMAVHGAWSFIRDVEHAYRCAVEAECCGETGGVGLLTAEPEDRIAIGDPVLNGGSVIEEHMGQARARPRGRMVLPEQVLWSARNVVDDRGVDIAQHRVLGLFVPGLDGEVLGIATAGEWVTVAVGTSRSVRTSWIGK